MEKTDHERFKSIIERVIAGRRVYHPTFDLEQWIYECYSDEERFLALFPDAVARLEMMERLEERSNDELQALRLSLAHIVHHGLRKSDIERLRHEGGRLPNEAVPMLEQWEEAEDERA